MKYQFIARLKDGKDFRQDPEDRHPTKPDKSSYTHLMEEAEVHGGIVLFQLIGKDHIYLVDLRDGHFEIDGIAFESQGKNYMLKPNNLELVYYRDITRKFNHWLETETETRFRFGWKMKDGDKVYQQTVSIK